MRNGLKITIFYILLIITATIISGCASIPIPSSIPLPNEIPILGMFL